jgi:glycosyltransferase involved in cell wall biosynthesis
MAQRGHQVQIFMPPWQTPEDQDKSWQEDGVGIRYTPLNGGVPGITSHLIRETMAWRPDVVHCFKPKAYSGLVAWWLWKFHRHQLRLVVDSDDWEGWGGWNEIAPYTTLQKHFFAWQERWGLRHCHAVTVASRTLQSLAWSQGVPQQKVFYLPNGPGIGNQQPAAHQLEGKLEERPVLLLYSRLFEFDTQRLVAILQGVKAAVPDLAILAVGAGLFDSDATQFRKQMAAAGLEEAIVDAGWVEPGNLPGLLARGDVGIYLMEDTLLNRTKCPVKLADMLSIGVPVVAEAVGQVSEYVIHNQTGLLRESGDSPGITADIVHLLRNPSERERLAAGAKEHMAKRFNWERLSQLLEQVYMACGDK